MICVKGERASSKGYRERRRAEHVEYTLGYNKIKKGAKRTVLLSEMLKHGRVSVKDWLKVYYGNRNTSEAYLTNALSSIPESIAPYEYKEGTTVYVDCLTCVDCLKWGWIQDLLDAWYAEEAK